MISEFQVFVSLKTPPGNIYWKYLSEMSSVDASSSPANIYMLKVNN